MEILQGLDLYDLMGYFVPGAVALWFALALANSRRRATNRIKLSPVALVVAAYLAGHMLQAVGSYAETLVNEHFASKSIHQRYADREQFLPQLRSSIEGAFGEAPQDSVFDLCLTYLRVRERTAFVDIMQSRYGFFRGLTLALFLATMSLVLNVALRKGRPLDIPVEEQLMTSRQALFFATLLLAGTMISFVRLVEFDRRFVTEVYRACSVDYALLTKAGGGQPAADATPPTTPP